MPFAELKAGYPSLTNALLSAKKGGRLGHAYLIQFDDLQTAKQFSLRISQLAACLSPLDNGDSCGKCRSCSAIESGSYQDMAVIAPKSKSRMILIGKDADDPDSIREFQSFFQLAASGTAGVKIGVIHDADRMTEEAQNAFLKTLEEPPGRSIFILSSSKPQMLLPTIRSRCQQILLLGNFCRYDFPGNDELFSALKDVTFGKNGLADAEKCAGRLLSISSDMKDSAEARVKKRWEKTTGMLENMDVSGKKRFTDRQDAEIQAEYLSMRVSFLSAIHAWFAQIFMLCSDAEPASIPNPEIFERLKGEKLSVKEKKAEKNLRHAEDFLQNLRWNVDEELAFREFCLKLASAD